MCHSSGSSLTNLGGRPWPSPPGQRGAVTRKDGVVEKRLRGADDVTDASAALGVDHLRRLDSARAPPPRPPHRGRRRRGPCDVALITTDLAASATAIVERCATRWSIEVAFEDAKQITGVGEARNRTEAAVRRTVPFGFISQGIVMIWYITRTPSRRCRRATPPPLTLVPNQRHTVDGRHARHRTTGIDCGALFANTVSRPIAVRNRRGNSRLGSGCRLKGRKAKAPVRLGQDSRPGSTPAPCASYFGNEPLAKLHLREDDGGGVGAAAVERLRAGMALPRRR